MGTRSNLGMARAVVREEGERVETVRVEVLALHPADDVACPCALSFSPRGVVLEDATGDPPARLLRVPWWTVHGFSADDTVQAPDGGNLQALDLFTDAGRLRLALRACDVGLVLSSLEVHAARWRRWRAPVSSWAARRSATAGAAGRRAAAQVGAAARVSRRRPVAALATSGLVLALAAAAAGASTLGLQHVAPGTHRPSGRTSVVAARGSVGVSGMAQFVETAKLDKQLDKGIAAHLVRATEPPPPAPPSITDAPALSAHEVFGFVPYWTLGAEAGFDLTGFTTLAYFAVGVNANGTLEESGKGWDGYESQPFADLVARAHAAGARVVLTVNCFSASALAELTSSRAAASELASSVLGAIAAKHLDGVNIDFEGGAPVERSGLTALVATVSTAVHGANPHFQVTVDTDGDAAVTSDTFYDVRALASATDGLFVMAYGLNYAAPPSATSPITSDEMSDLTEAAQYASTVPPAKVIFGTSYFGYSWATTNGTMGAHAVATGTPVTYGQVLASGQPLYWDPVTETAWTSYERGGQWYEDYVDDPASIYLVAALAKRERFAGVGVWALGMDGNDPQMTAALDGNAPAERAGPAGPIWTAPSRTPKRLASGARTTTAKTAPTSTTTTTVVPSTTVPSTTVPSSVVPTTTTTTATGPATPSPSTTTPTTNSTTTTATTTTVPSGPPPSADLPF